MVSFINTTYEELLLVQVLVQELVLAPHQASAQEPAPAQEPVQVLVPLQASALQPFCSRLQT